jgi:hypothetical protein
MLLGAPKNADSHIVNCVQPHPSLPYVLTAGIDDDIKIVLPDSQPVLSRFGIDPKSTPASCRQKHENDEADLTDLLESLDQNRQSRPKYLKALREATSRSTSELRKKSEGDGSFQCLETFSDGGSDCLNSSSSSSSSSDSSDDSTSNQLTIASGRFFRVSDSDVPSLVLHLIGVLESEPLQNASDEASNERGNASSD